MKIVYQELVTQNDFNQCIDMQRNLFKLSDIDIVSPLILQLNARKNIPTGLTIGAFVENNNRELVGFILAFATFQDQSLYGAMIGVKPQYQNQGIGLNLILSLKEIAIQRGISFFYGIYEPLNSKLAYLYINYLKFKGVQYIENAIYQQNSEEDVDTDKILFKWDLKASFLPNKERNSMLDKLDRYPTATQDYLPESPSVLVEIPESFSLMEKENKEDARYWRQFTRKVFSHYINDHNYVIHDFLSFEENGLKKYFYLLKDQ